MSIPIQRLALLAGAVGCTECHSRLLGGLPSGVFDRLVLIDPFDENGDPVYETVRELTGLDPK